MAVNSSEGQFDTITDKAGSGSPAFPNGLSSAGPAEVTKMSMTSLSIDTSSTGVIIGLPFNATTQLQNASITSLSGIIAASQGSIAVIHNQTGLPLTIVHEDSANVATAANRIQLAGATQIVLQPANLATFIYESSRWRLISMGLDYEEYTHNTDFTLENTSSKSGSKALGFTRIGNTVTVSMPIILVPGAANALTTIFNDTPIPSRFRPSTTYVIPGGRTLVNTVSQNDPSGFTIGVDGLFRITRNMNSSPPTWPTTGNNGHQNAFTFSYRID